MVLTPTRIPRATYRLQFSKHLRFDDARKLVGYLDELGISDAYPSPLFRARENSSHGYDVIDPGTIDPEFGAEADFQAFAQELHDRGLGLMIDIVPNHMGIDDQHNGWWQDVLENGTSSLHARFFDIDWRPPKDSLRGRVLLPFLGDQFGKVLENQELRLVYEDHRFRIAYYDRRFPVAPRSSRIILELVLVRVAAALPGDDAQRMELESVMTALDNLPSRDETSSERIAQRYREKEVIRRRLATLYDTSAVIHEAVDEAVQEINGRRGDPRSFDRLEALLDQQAYRLSSWRVAADEINYRRFFDINALAAIRVEDPEVFAAVHAMTFRFLEAGWVTGLRIDHPDGLLDPQKYFEDLQRCYRETFEAARPPQGEPAAPEEPPALYLVVEKILASDEELPVAWPVCGTTGYDFLNQVGGLLVDRRGAYALGAIYTRFTGLGTSFPDVLYESKRTILTYSMSSELFVLAGQLDRISQQHRWSRDFTRSALHRALREVIACFPVYRTYVRPGTQEVSADDRRRILLAVRLAKRRNPAMSASFFDFLASVLLLEHPDGLAEQDRQERLHFVLKFQQVTGPVMAKGLEDTAFYRHYPLASLNDVGGDPTLPGISVEQFHRRNTQRLEVWPYTLSTTSTHDTKRGEDLRARLSVLSEVPELWDQAIRRWQTTNAPRRSEIDGQAVPDANEEYLLYQTLVGTWPLSEAESIPQLEYVERIVQYMDKALKEAKLHTSWANPDEAYGEAVSSFVRAVLDRNLSAAFLDDLDAWVRHLADAGYLNSLAQALLKLVSPGTPDFYQGTELWDFSLVDPDNRRAVDFERRRWLLAELKSRAAADAQALATELLAAWPDERIKLFLIERTLGLRRADPGRFLAGSYIPLAVEGPRVDNVCALAREHDDRWVLAAVPRLSMAAWHPAPETTGEPAPPHGPIRPGPALGAWWKGTSLRLPPDAPSQWRHVLTGKTFSTDPSLAYGRLLDLGDLFGTFPVTLLDGRS